jgi:hypothetical protein
MALARLAPLIRSSRHKIVATGGEQVIRATMTFRISSAFRHTIGKGCQLLVANPVAFP